MQCFKEFLKYAALNIIGMLGLSCYILADTFFISKGLGADGLAALNIIIPVYSFMNGIGLMLGMGGATRYAIYKSQQKKENGSRVFSITLFMGMFFAVIFAGLGIFFAEPLTGLLGAEGAVFMMSKTYLKVLLLFSPCFLLNNILLCFVRNDGAPQLSMAAMLCGSFSNILLDYIFIFICKMGIFGAVFATSLSPVINMLVLSVFFLKKKNQFHFAGFCSWKWMKGEGNLPAAIISAGVPSLVAEVASGIVILVFNMIMLELEGNVGVAAYGVIANLSLVVIAVYTGLSQGIQPVMSQAYGRGDKKNVRALVLYGIGTVVLLYGLIYLGIFFGAEQIAAVFNSEGNRNLQKIAVEGLRLYFSGCVFAGINIVLSVCLTSTDNSRPAGIISVLRGFAVIIPMTFLLSFAFGVQGLWCAFPLTECIVSCIGFGCAKKYLR